MGDTTDLVSIQKYLGPNQNLIAVSKLQSISKINKLYAEGQRHFGENYIQEALEKIHHLKLDGIQWHFIGRLQNNKVKYLQNNFSFIHSVDSLQLATKISASALKINYKQKVFIQVNLSSEVSKSGFSEIDLAQTWTEMSLLKGIQVVGLMTMPPLENNAEENRKYFKKLSLIANKYQLTELSMGTSQDYQIALEEGATWIRLGTILFGERPKK